MHMAWQAAIIYSGVLDAGNCRDGQSVPRGTLTSRTVWMAAWFMRFMMSAPVKPAVARPMRSKESPAAIFLPLACTA